MLRRLRSQFADTSIIEAYVSAYQEEQKKIRSTALRDRANATRLLDEAKNEITEIIRMMSKGLVDDDEGAALLAPLRKNRDEQKANLDSVEEPPNVIELQPKAVRRFRENIESLAQIVAEKDGEPSPELVGPFRQLVAAVVVQPSESGEAYEVGIKGYLSSLVNTELSVIKMVAEDRCGLYLRLDDPGLIDFGNWQVSLKRAISEYLRPEVGPEPANTSGNPIVQNQQSR